MTKLNKENQEWLEKNKFNGINVDGNPVYKKADVESKLLELQKENQELKAHNELLMDASWRLKEGEQDAFYDIKSVRSSTPKQSLADIQANAIKKVESLFAMKHESIIEYGLTESDCIQVEAWLCSYVDKLREGNSNE